MRAEEKELQNTETDEREEWQRADQREAVDYVRSLDMEEGEELERALWKAVSLHAGLTFHTAKGLPFHYSIKGRELFCDRKEKSITSSTVLKAYQKIRKAEKEGTPITGPKKLNMFGAPYMWGILKQIGL